MPIPQLIVLPSLLGMLTLYSFPTALAGKTPQQPEFDIPISSHQTPLETVGPPSYSSPPSVSAVHSSTAEKS